MGFYEVLDKHPLKLIVGVIITTAAITYGITHRIEESEKNQLREKYDAQIRDLNFKFSSIERKVGNEKSYFDITKLIVTSSDARRLPSEFESYADGRIYISLPSDESWYFEESNKYDFLKCRYGSQVDRIIEGSKRKRLYKNSKLMTWRKQKVFQTKLTHRDVDNKILPLTITCFPSATIQEFSLQNILDLGIEHVTKNNLSTIVLSQKIRFDMFQAEQYGNTEFRIIDAQKKGPVFYMLSELVHKNAIVDGMEKEREMTIEKEAIFVSLGDRGLLINTTIPSCEKRSMAYPWVSNWLAGLRIVTE